MALIVGCGAVGRRLAHALSSAGEPVRGVVRSPDSAQALAEEGIGDAGLQSRRGEPAAGCERGRGSLVPGAAPRAGP